MGTEIMPIDRLIRERREEILEIATRHGAANVRLVGSVARGEEDPESDVDLLVDEGPATDSWNLRSDLEKLLGRHVDVITDRNIHPLLRPHILPDAIPLDRPLPHIPRRLTKKKKDDRIYLEHILYSWAKVQEYTGAERRTFFESDLARDASILRLQNLTESTQKLSAELKARHPEIAWGEIAGLRNRLVHGYLPGHLDLEILWTAIEHHLPALVAVVTAELEVH